MSDASWNRDSLLAAVDAKMVSLGYRNPLLIPVNPFDIAHREGVAIEYKGIRDTNVCAILFNTTGDPRVVLNSLTPKMHVFSLMHELIHFWFHPAQTYYDKQGSRMLVDTQANYAAAEALMPSKAVREIAEQLNYDIVYTAHAFGVSYDAMAVRFNELRLQR